MTPDDVRKRVEEWWPSKRDANGLVTCDNEGTHSEEDDLLYEVLTAIATGTATDPAACAREAVRMRENEYHRWYE